MRRLLARSWWFLVARGLASIAFGGVALAWPGAALLFLLAVFAAYAIITGAAAFACALRNRKEPGAWLVMLLGMVSLAMGALAILAPAITVLALLILIGVNAVVSGVLDISMAARLRRELRNEWLLGLAGALSIAFGAVMLVFPEAGALALVWLIGTHAIAIGAVFVLAGLRVRSAGRASLRPPPSGASYGAI